MITKPSRLSAAVAAVVAATIGVTACGGSSKPTSDPPKQTTTNTTTKATSSGSPVAGSTCRTTQLTDRSHDPVYAVITGTDQADSSPSITRTKKQTFAAVLQAGFANKAMFISIPIGATNDEVATSLDTSTAANSFYGSADEKCLTGTLTDRYQQIVANPAAGALDVPSGLNALASKLGQLGHRNDIEVVISSSMLNAISPADLTNPATLAGGPGPAVQALARQGLLPSCKGWHVSVVGAGQTNKGPVSDEQWAADRAFWTAAFAACGGQLMTWDTGAPAAFPPKTAEQPPVAAKPEPPPAPHVQANTITQTLPATSLFALGSAVLDPADTSNLQLVLTTLTTKDPKATAIAYGYCDPIGGSYNTTLAKLRAQAVVNWLTANGVAAGRVQAVGQGDQDPVAPPDDQGEQPLDRRVEIQITR